MTAHKPQRSAFLKPPPWWLIALAIATDVGTGAWQLISASHGSVALFLGGLAWPGLAIALVVAVVAWLGWTLDLE
jgi:hypothetical protein